MGHNIRKKDRTEVHTHTALLALFWICIFKLGYWAALLSAVKLWGNFNVFDVLYWPRNTALTLSSHFIPYDGSFYLSIGETGYHAGDRACAFYPLWPLIIRWVSHLAHGEMLVTGLVSANVLSLIAWLLFFHIVSQHWGPNVATWALVYLIAFPGSLFYHFLYSESLFLLLLMGLWWALQHEYYGLAFGLAFLVPLTRAIGVFCLFPICWYILAVSPPNWLKHRPRLFALLRGPNNVPGAQKALRGWWLASAPLAGWLVYLSLMFLWTGNPFEGFAAQKYWEVHSVNNLWNVPKFVAAFLTPDTWHAFSGSLLDRSIFALLVCCLPLVWKLDRRLIAWVCVLGILPAMSGTFTSYTRFASVAFPLFIALGVYFAPPERRYLRYGVLGVFVVIHITLVWRYVNFQWAS